MNLELEKRLPPHSLEAEQGLLGCMLLNPPECIPVCVEALKAGKETFYDLRHQEIFSAIVQLAEAGPVDVITLGQKLKDANLIEQVGGHAYLFQVQDSVASTANLMGYISIVKEKRVLRNMLQACTEAIAKIYDEPDKPHECVDGIEADLLRISEERVEALEKTADTLVMDVVDRLEFYHKNKGKLVGLPSGLRVLDRSTFGFRNQHMILIAARPSVGKTALGMNIAEHIAVDHNLPVGVFSLEMSAEALMMRMAASRANVNSRSLESGMATEKEYMKVNQALIQIKKARLYIDDSSGLTINQLKAKARRMTRRYKLKAIFVDYIQLLATPSRMKRQEAIVEISTGIKLLAKELNIPVFAMCQLNRESEKDKGREPRLTDLRESGQFEQDADVVIMLWDAGDGTKMKIAKQREGPRDVFVPCVFTKEYTRFSDVPAIDPKDFPSSC